MQTDLATQPIPVQPVPVQSVPVLPAAVRPRVASRRRAARALLVAVVVLLLAGAATVALLPATAPDPHVAPRAAAPAPAAPPPAPSPVPAPSSVSSSVPSPVPSVDLEQVALPGKCPARECTARYRVVNRGPGFATGTFTLRVDGQLVSTVPVDVPPRGTVEVAVRFPASLLARPGKVRLDATFRPDQAPTT